MACLKAHSLLTVSCKYSCVWHVFPRFLKFIAVLSLVLSNLNILIITVRFMNYAEVALFSQNIFAYLI